MPRAPLQTLLPMQAPRPEDEAQRSRNLRAKRRRAEPVPGEAVSSRATGPEEAPAGKTATEKTPTEKTPTEKTPTEKTPTEKTPTEKTPTEKTPTEKTPTGNTATEETATEKTHSEAAEPGATSSENLAAEDAAAEKQRPIVRVTHLPEDQRPRERLLNVGGAALSDAELVAVLLRCGRPGQSVLEMAREVLDEHGGLAGLLGATRRSLERYGLGRAKAATLLTAIELGRRLARARLPEREILDCPELVAGYLALRYGQSEQEIMGALYLDVRQRLVADVEIYRGTQTWAAVEPRAILKEGLERGAASFILFHNHPSGDPSPSTEDLGFTRRLAKAAALLGIELVDHLILGHFGRWVSLARRGDLS